MHSHVVPLSEQDVQNVLVFIEAMALKQERKGSRDYVRNDKGKHRLDQGFIGKLAEVAAAKLLHCDVDWRIWKTGSRGIDQFEPDLIPVMHNKHGALRFHVKCCNMQHTTKRRGIIYPISRSSWTVDLLDPLQQKPQANDIVLLMFASVQGKAACAGWVRANEVQSMWKPCQSPHMVHKVALYWEDIAHVVHDIDELIWQESMS